MDREYLASRVYRKGLLPQRLRLGRARDSPVKFFVRDPAGAAGLVELEMQESAAG